MMIGNLDPPAAAEQWIRTFAPRPAATRRVLCFPHAGGSASTYRALALAAPEDVEISAVQYPGRQDRFSRAMPDDLAALADAIAADVGATVRRSTAFFGHSMGAVVAFEVARRLRPRFPAPLARLYVSAAKAPPEFAEKESVLDDEGIRRYLEELGGTDATVLDEPELWQIALHTLRADFTAIDRYRFAPGPPLGCPITAIAGDRDLGATPADMQRWQQFTVSGFTAHTVPGGHFALPSSPDTLLELLAGAGR
jgi:surfactin synthase thioesterase subunit